MIDTFSARAPALSLRLVGLNGELAGKSFRIAPGMVLGRSASADVFLPDPAVARVQCRVEATPAGYLHLCAARAGDVRVNGRSIRMHRIEPGDEWEIGRFRLRCERGEETTPDPPIADRAAERAAATAERSRGLALVARPRTLEGLSTHGSFLAHAIPIAKAIVRRAKGQTASGEVGLVRAWWPMGDDALRRAAAVWRELSKLAFLSCSAAEERGWTTAFAVDDVWRQPMGTRRRLLWGPAMDRAGELASLGSPRELLYSSAPGEQEGELALVRSLHSPSRVVAMRETVRGRRERFQTCLSWELQEADLCPRILVTRLHWDPLHRLLMVDALAREWLSMGETYRASFLRGSLECHAAAPLADRRGYRVRLTTTAPARDLGRWLAEWPLPSDDGSRGRRAA